MALSDILSEFEGGCFYTDELLAQAYSTTVECLRAASPMERSDPRLPAFLKAGYLAHLRERSRANKLDALIHQVALKLASPSHPAADMVGGLMTLRQRPAASSAQSAPSPAKPTPAKPTPSRAESPARQTPTPEELPTSPASPVQSPERTAKRPRSRSPSPEPVPEAQPEVQPEPEPEVQPEVQPEIEILQSRERYLRRFKTTFREETAQIKGLGQSLPSEAQGRTGGVGKRESPTGPRASGGATQIGTGARGPHIAKRGPFLDRH